MRYQTILSAVLLLAALVSLTMALAPPVWPVQFQQTFSEKLKYGPFHSQTSGSYFYDALNNFTRIDRVNGEWDRYCGSVWKLKNTPCTQLVRNGLRYLIAPQRRECCMCCNAQQGCGILNRNWLFNATYEGTSDFNGQQINKWNKKGLQNNYYAATADSKQVPVFVDMQPDDYIEYDVNSYVERIVDPSVFDLPSYCDPSKKCPFISICSLLNKN